MVAPNIAPDSRLKRADFGLVFRGSQAWRPIFCANCSKPAGFCPETTTYLFYLCDGCVEKHGAPAGTYLIPDEVFYAKCREAQIEEHGRELNVFELGSLLEEGASPLAKLLTLGQ